MKNIIILVFILLFAGCSTYGPIQKPNLSSRKIYVKNQDNLTAEIKNAILDGKIIKGMAKDDVLTVWGKPYEVSYYPKPYTHDYEKYYEFWFYNGHLAQLLSRDCHITFFKDKVEEVGCGNPWSLK